MMHSLVTKRLELKPMEEKDWSFIASLFSHPILHQFEQGELPTTTKIREQFDRALAKSDLLPLDGGIWFIIQTMDHQAIGQLKLTCNWSETQEWELGYALSPEHWGKGFAYEAADAALNWAFEELKVHKILAIINAENKRSVALARKIGMIEEAHLREARIIQGQYYDEKVFAMLVSDLARSRSK